MPTLTPTADVHARSATIGATSTDPARQMLPAEHESFLEGSGLNGAFVADLLSNMLTHERCGVHLYRSLAQRTLNPVLKAKYEEFEGETLHHVDVLEQLIAGIGGDPMYVSPAARATEKANTGLLESTFMLAGSVDLMTQELVMLDAVLLAEAKDHANWSCLASMVDSFPEGSLREQVRSAVERVESQEDEHLGWAKDTRCKMISMQASSSAVTKAAAKAEEAMATIKGWFT